MAVAKRQGREKPVKIEQRKVWGPEWGPQVEQTKIYIGQAQGEGKKKKTYKNWSQRTGGLSPAYAHSLFLFIHAHPALLFLSCFSSHLLGRLLKNPPAMWQTWVPSLGWEDPLEKEGKGYPLQYSGLENSMDCSWHCSRVRHNWVTFTFSFQLHALRMYFLN